VLTTILVLSLFVQTLAVEPVNLLLEPIGVGKFIDPSITCKLLLETRKQMVGKFPRGLGENQIRIVITGYGMKEGLVFNVSFHFDSLVKNGDTMYITSESLPPHTDISALVKRVTEALPRQLRKR
jgi:hypothetical protein